MKKKMVRKKLYNKTEENTKEMNNTNIINSSPLKFRLSISSINSIWITPQLDLTSNKNKTEETTSNKKDNNYHQDDQEQKN